MTVIIVRGGLNAGDPDHATADGRHWTRPAGVPLAAFIDRVTAEAPPDAVVIVGGLPE